jgi:hypothetical protein
LEPDRGLAPPTRQVAGGYQPGHDGRVTITPIRRLTAREQKAAERGGRRYRLFVEAG